ncbi:MAG TPA: Hsp20/alpha crystallin family protein [Acidimicrobiales bacterium]
MFLRTDPYREFGITSTLSSAFARQLQIPIDVYRSGDAYLIQFDLPGVHPDSIDVTVKKNVLTVSAQLTRPDHGAAELLFAERPKGVVSRQVSLGEEIDTERIEADYLDGVLILRLPVAEAAQPQKIRINTHGVAESLSA